MKSPKPGEEGAALLAVLLLVAVMSALAAASLERLQLATRLAGNIASLDQARAYATGAEALAITRINDLVGSDLGKTTLEGDWNGAESVLPLPDEGVAVARAWDGGNCFNLNSVVRGVDVRNLTVNPLGVRQFTALMVALEIPEGDARRIAAALGDWIDSDDQPTREGAEDRVYSGADTPYRAANTLVAEVSELRAVAGVAPEYYQRLRPWLCALPIAELSPINVNTLLPEQAPLIAMLLPDQLTVNQALQILEERPPTGWNNTAEFWGEPILAGLSSDGEITQQPQVRTRWFKLDLDVRLGDVDLAQSALIDAGVAPARVVSRRWGREE